MARYLVTGGLGVVGSEFTRWALSQGHEVLIIDAAEEPRNKWLASSLARHAEAVKIPAADRQPRGLSEARMSSPLAITAERLELMQPSALATLIGASDFVVHAAAHTGIPHSAQDPCDDWHSNVDATRAILEALRRLGPDKAPPTVMLSSVKPYDVSDVSRVAATGVDESFPMAADEPYAASKLAQSAIAQAYARSYGLPITVIRCSNLYGPAPCHGPRHGWLTWFCIAAALDLPIRLEGTGRQQRDVLFTSDITLMIRAVLRAGDRTRGRVLNAGGGRPALLSVNDAAVAITQLLVEKGRPAPRFVTAGGRDHDDAIFCTDHRALTTACGWFPLVKPFGPEGGINQILDWALANEAELRELYIHQILRPG